LDEKTVTIERIGPIEKPSKAKPPEDDGGAGPLPELGDILNLGEKAWKIIADNKPVVDVKNEYATGLPKGARGWQDLEGWQPPSGTVYVLRAKNKFGAEVINVRYQVLRTYGGTYRGKGRYLTAVTVEPLLVAVSWGYRFALEASVPDTSVVNVGTSDDPVAGMMAQLAWRIATVLKDTQGRDLYFLQGDGAFREVGGPASAPALDETRRKAGALETAAPPFD
jgi:hypothetical protein